MTCLPWWHNTFAPLIATGRKWTLRSGCSTVDGNVTCTPETMRAQTEKQLRTWNYWSSWRTLPLATYTLARYIASELGSGTAEERAAIGVAAVNQAKLRKLPDVNGLLLYPQAAGNPHRGFYGPIHGPEGITTAPYGRWAATSLDPTIVDVLIANFVLDGGTGDFAKGADDQVGPEAWTTDVARQSPLANGSRRNYWIGPTPGIDHWRTFLYTHRPDIDPTQPVGRALIAQGVSALSDRTRPDWSHLGVCARRPWLVAALVGVGGVGLSLAMSRHPEVR